MRLLATFFIASLFMVSTAQAETEGIATTGDKGMYLRWWPKLPTIAGWHWDRESSAQYSMNALAPDHATFADAETVMYARAIFKPRDPEITSIEMLIARDKKDFLAHMPGIKIQDAQSLPTADGKKFRSITFFPQGTGNWERVSYGEEGEFFLIFTISSRSKAGFDASENAYEKLIGLYQEKP